MSGILLHPRLGINPRLTFCQRCGGEAQELVMLGSRNYKDTCQRCGLVHFGGAEGRRCGNPDCRGHDLHREELTDQEKLPSPSLCTKCAAIQKECDDAVAAGGVYWKCEGCGSEGAVVAESELAKTFRAEHPEHDGKPLGVLLGECPVCPKSEEPDSPEEGS